MLSISAISCGYKKLYVIASPIIGNTRHPWRVIEKRREVFNKEEKNMKLIKQLLFGFSIALILFMSCSTLEQKNGLKNNWIAVFKDKNLEHAIRENINKQEGDIYVSDLKDIKKLDVKGKDITELEGIENCENLTFLNIAGNPIRDMSILSKLPYLEALIIGYSDPIDEKLYYNQKIDITTLSDLSNLKLLHLAWFNWENKNAKTDISIISNLTKLTSLQLVGNNIEDISPISKLKNLKCLVLASNKIKDLTPLSGLTKLLRLSIDGNNITDISPLSKLIKLRALYLSWNHISNIKALSNLSNLGDISYLEKNLDDEIELAWIKKDKSLLWLSYNNINDITPLLTNYNNGGLHKLSIIYINNNNMDLTSDSVNRKVLQTFTQAGIEFNWEEGNRTQ